MIVCHCTRITDHDIRAAVDWMRAADPHTIITPGKVWRALGKRAQCGGCLPLVLDTMLSCDNLKVPPNLRGCGRAPEATGRGSTHEGRQEGHRLPQRRAQK
ncbi:MAG: (2Fe-2S)-binding protein [Rhodobacteraceae bacterium]|nr:(2Fe-2S)-binding protein [Paracoccaceae bacterium]